MRRKSFQQQQQFDKAQKILTHIQIEKMFIFSCSIVYHCYF